MEHSYNIIKRLFNIRSHNVERNEVIRLYKKKNTFRVNKLRESCKKCFNNL